VFLNNQPGAVSFNDVDSFRIIKGNPQGSQSRLAGFNTLESHGPVHRWGGWHFKELYVNAKQATLNARRGVWHCESDLSADGYGRNLWTCLDLAEDQIRKGLAHAMSVTDEPAHPRLLAAQADAITHKRGMWAKGVPTYIVTSIHSADEPRDRPGLTFNRLVNTVDGHSKRWTHTDNYKECQVICHQPIELTLEQAKVVVGELRADPETAPMVRGVDDVLVALSINTFLQNGFVPKIFGANNDKLGGALETLKAAGRFAEASRQEASCGVHVTFERRYRRPKPACLKW
jgi:endonuclease YncB( thermonuclease family)